MSTNSYQLNFALEPDDTPRLVNLCGPMNSHIQQLEEKLDVKIFNRGNHFSISGTESLIKRTERVIKALYASTEAEELSPNSIHLYLQDTSLQRDGHRKAMKIHTQQGVIAARNLNQEKYLQTMHTCALTFGVGPAGTGKTYLAVVAAVEALNQGRVKKLILVRPAVEAGEQLGFLPGDMAQKVDPYLRPLYDGLYDTLGQQRVEKLINSEEIEIAPLAYMRGRSLNEAFIILDEAQNTTVKQMRMFLTRIGFDSKAVVTGDITQVDLPKNKQSGLRHALDILRDIPGVGFTFFRAEDVVRHNLIQAIIRAYEENEG